MARLRTFTGTAALLLSLVCIIAPACAQQLSADLNAALSEADSLASLLDTLELAKCRAGLPSKLPCPSMPSSVTWYHVPKLTLSSSTFAQVLLLPQSLPHSRPFPRPPPLHRRPSSQPRHQPPLNAPQARGLELCDPIKLIDKSVMPAGQNLLLNPEFDYLGTDHYCTMVDYWDYTADSTTTHCFTSAGATFNTLEFAGEKPVVTKPVVTVPNMISIHQNCSIAPGVLKV